MLLACSGETPSSAGTGLTLQSESESGATAEKDDKTFNELALEEETAEAGAKNEMEEFEENLKAGTQTSLVQVDHQIASGIIGAIAWFLYVILVGIGMIAVCTLALKSLLTTLTMGFSAIKATFRYVMGKSSPCEFGNELYETTKKSG